MAWLSFDLARHFTLVTTDFALQIVGTCTFIAVLTVIHLTLLIRECDLQRWQHLLNSNRQQLADATSDLELKAFLDRLRWRLLTREVAAALALGLGVIALQATLLRSSQFELPIGAVLMLLGMLGATAFDRCINAVARLMSGNSATLGTAVLNVAQSQPPEQERDTLARIGKRAVEGIFKLFGLLAAVMVVIKLVAEIPNVIEVWKALQRLF